MRSRLLFDADGRTTQAVWASGEAALTVLDVADDADPGAVYPGFPADVLFNFQFLSMANQLVLWSSLGLIFESIVERVLRPGSWRR
ncbi:hypothetical protein KGQ20_13770 [Catenulispora sp. NF23]|uniref:hypothetical protein n=1 Tax=Catenulispora pinistramenti TaxID=2705254 RepID=UPI001BA9F5F1|nr:hypothetical protein [Catenulispora pinistramenti]MBS2533836.1 hypothetical protein [Catenulispora pinistramenti]